MSQDIRKEFESKEKKCSYCGKKMNEEELVVHKENCEFSLVTCEQCGVLVQRFYMTNHLEEVCEKRCVHCEYCKASIVVDVFQQHFDVCEFIPVLCENKCGKVMSRKDMKRHLLKECPQGLAARDEQVMSRLMPYHPSACEKYPVNCPYSNSAIIPREDQSNQLNEECVKTYTNCSVPSVPSIFKGFPAEENTHHIQGMKEMIELLSRKLEIVEDQSRTIESLQNELQDKERRIARLEQEVRELKDKNHKVINGRNVKFLQRVSNVSKKYDQLLSSDVFYDIEYGYKLKMVLSSAFVIVDPCFPDFQEATLGFQIIICSGEYVPVQWPSIRRFSVRLVDLKDKRNDYVLSIQGDHDICIRKPFNDDDNCRPHINYELITYEKLKSGNFLDADDSILVEVTGE